MRLNLEFFGPIGDQVGNHRTKLTLDGAPKTVADLVEQLASQLENGGALRDPHLRLAINDQFCGKTDAIVLNDGDHIAVLSPFSGG